MTNDLLEFGVVLGVNKVQILLAARHALLECELEQEIPAFRTRTVGQEMRVRVRPAGWRAPHDLDRV